MKDGQWFNLWDYFRIHGFKVSELNREESKIKFIELGPELKERIRIYKEFYSIEITFILKDGTKQFHRIK